MKKITFNELCDLVSKVDYINSNSYPINFVANGDEFCVGIGMFDTALAKVRKQDIENFFCGLEDELQYLLRFDYDEENDELCGTYLDVQDPDNMVYDDIVSMLQKQCNINEKSLIYLYEDESFDGSRDYMIKYEELSTEVLFKEQNNPCRLCEIDFCPKNCKKINDFTNLIKEKFA